MNKLVNLGALSCITSLNLLACTVASDDESTAYQAEDFDAIDQAIREGQNVQASSKYDDSTVGVGGCTGTIIGPRHVLTAAHCGPVVGTTVTFYNGALPTGVTRTVTNVYMRWGVSTTDTVDVDGRFADHAVLLLSAAIPTGYVPAKIPVTWPGNNVTMTQVGRGAHDGNANPTAVLRYRNTLSYSSSNAEGHVLVEAALNPGDSGGPIYTTWGSRLAVQGVTWGNVPEWALRGKYTSTAFHFWNIANAVGITNTSNWNLPGNDISSTDNVSLAECVSLCMTNASCKAYTLTTVVPGGTANPPFGRCYQKTGPGSGGSAQAGRFSGTKATTGACTLSGGYCRI